MREPNIIIEPITMGHNFSKAYGYSVYIKPINRLSQNLNLYKNFWIIENRNPLTICLYETTKKEKLIPYKKITLDGILQTEEQLKEKADELCRARANREARKERIIRTQFVKGITKF